MLSTNQKTHYKTTESGIEYYSVEGLQEVKTEMLRLLKIIDKICIDNNIRYWIDGGSLIGVLRHDGFIPWDDDLDISMLKKDYIKLIEALTQYEKDHNDAYLFYKSPQNLHVCNYFASKRIFSRTQGSVLMVPAKVDIRPVNCIKNTSSERQKNLELRDIANILIYKKKYGYTLKIPKGKKEIIDFFDNYNNNYGIEDPYDNVFFAHPYFEYSSKFDLKIQDIYPLIRHKFENIEVSIPNNYDYILSNLYGDYMKLPTLEHRVPVACSVSELVLTDSQYKKYIEVMYNLSGSLVSKNRKILETIKLFGIFPTLKIIIYERIH